MLSSSLMPYNWQQQDATSVTICENEIQLFREVVHILKDQDIYFWLDQGSLLGSVRNGHFLAWDHDVDIGMTVTDQQVSLIAKELIKLGGTLECYPYVLRLMRKKHEKSVDMRIYTSHGLNMTTQMRASLPGNKSLAHRIGLKLCILGQRGSSKLVRQIAYLLHSPKSFHFRYPLQIAYNIAFAFARLTDSWRHYYRQRIVYFSVPSSYFSNLDAIIVHDMHLPIPSEVESYLQMKYGHDWRVPNHSWKYWRDDGAISTES